MEKIWAYEDNVFLNVTDHSYELMYTLNDFHANALLQLSNIPFFAERYEFYKPLSDRYVKVFNVWKQSGGKQKSETLSVNQLLKLTTQKLNGWEPRITLVYLPGTAGYTNLYPQYRYPFTTGSKEQRIAAFKTLSDALAQTPALKDVQGEVYAYWEQLTEQHNEQSQSKNAKSGSSDDLEAARVAACDGMFCNLGYTMAYYYTDRHRIGNLFDLENIRHHEQVVFQRHVKAEHTLFVVKHKFAAGEMITCQNKGVTKLYLYEAGSKTEAYVEGTGIVVMPGETVTVDAGKIGAPDKAFLMLHNPDEINEGDCEISFL